MTVSIKPPRSSCGRLVTDRIHRTCTRLCLPNTDWTHSYPDLRYVLRPHNHPTFVSPILTRFTTPNTQKESHSLPRRRPRTHVHRKLLAAYHTLPRISNSGDQKPPYSPQMHAPKNLTMFCTTVSIDVPCPE